MDFLTNPYICSGFLINRYFWQSVDLFSAGWSIFGFCIILSRSGWSIFATKCILYGIPNKYLGLWEFALFLAKCTTLIYNFSQNKGFYDLERILSILCTFLYFYISTDLLPSGWSIFGIINWSLRPTDLLYHRIIFCNASTYLL